MSEGPIKIKNIATVLSNGVATNILSFKEEFVMNFTPQFIPNTYPSLGMLEKSKWRVLTFTIDSDNDVFDYGFGVGAANSALGRIESLAYGTGTTVFTLGETVTGAVTGATGVVVGWTVTGGTWALGTAAGVVYLASGTLTFQAVENINGSVGGLAMAATTAIETTVFAALPYDTGTAEFTLAETVTGAVSLAAGTVEYWTVTSGTWALGTAAGVVYLSGIIGPPYQAEAITGNLTGAANATGPEVAVFAVTFIIADAAGTVETWTYTATSSYMQRKEFGRIEDGAMRNTVEYQVLMHGTKVIS